MFEHFAKKNSGIYFSKNAKEKSKKLIFPKYKKSKNMFFSFFRVSTWKINVFFRTKSNFRLDLVLTNFLYKITIEK